MKTFEERFTAWVDGQLTGAELASFEKELAAHPDAAAERDSARQLGQLLRTHATAPALGNADFFALQLQQRIAAEAPAPRHESPARGGSFFWPLSRLVWAGAACLGIAGLLYQTMIPGPAARQPSDYFAQVVEAWPSAPGISATTLYNPQDNVTVLWLDGLDYMPGDKTQ
jgi:anti-sigma factor RsiW